MLAVGREIQEKCFDANLAKTQNDDVCLIELLADLVRVVLSLYNSFLWIFYFSFFEFRMSKLFGVTKLWG